jgi:hypothetical protein
MLSFTVWHLFALVVGLLLLWAFIAVFGRILSRAGYSRWWLVTIFIPVLNLIMLWVFAFADWPRAKQDAAG